VISRIALAFASIMLAVAQQPCAEPEGLTCTGGRICDFEIDNQMCGIRIMP
jgi:hypothetical protein